MDSQKRAGTKERVPANVLYVPYKTNEWSRKGIHNNLHMDIEWKSLRSLRHLFLRSVNV